VKKAVANVPTISKKRNRQNSGALQTLNTRQIPLVSYQKENNLGVINEEYNNSNLHSDPDH